MLAYLVRRLALSLVVVLAASFASFWVIGAHVNALGSLYLRNPRPVAEIHRLTVANHLDKPIPERYALWLKGVVLGGDGRTTVYGVPIWQEVEGGFVHTSELAAGAIVVAFVLSVALGMLAVVRRGRATDWLLRLLGYLTWSTPVFITAFLLQAAIAKIDTAWGVHPFYTYGLASGTGLAYFASWFRHLTLPIVAVALSFIGLYSRYIRSGMLVTLYLPHVTVARAKGLTEPRVHLRHALRNALIPFFAVLTLDFSAVVGATLVVDVIFRLQGLGTILFHSIGAIDIDPFEIQALVLVMVLAVIAFGFLADLLLMWLDPRIRIT